MTVGNRVESAAVDAQAGQTGRMVRPQSNVLRREDLPGIQMEGVPAGPNDLRFDQMPLFREARPQYKQSLDD